MTKKCSNLHTYNVNCDIPNMSTKWWLKSTLTCILKMLTLTFPICQQNDD